MITLNQLALRRGQQLLFSNATLTIHASQRVGITGANGTGKSSLFKLMLGELDADRGDFSLPPNLQIAHVAQEITTSNISAINYVQQGDKELIRIREAIGKAEAEGNAQTLGHLYQQLENVDGYTADSRAAILLNGLGFSTEEITKPCNTFSGGWRMRLNLAQALMCRSDLLLLDEPTNHLDLDAVIWLENWLKKYSGTLLLISHDRDFLDNLCNQILHIENQQVTLYSGNYSDFEQRRATQLSQQTAAYVKQQKQIEHMQKFVARFGAKATKAKQAQSRLKALERMTKIAPAHVDSPFSFTFSAPDKLPRPLLNLSNVSAGYENAPILSNINLVIQPGDRLALLGHNGAGKSTLVKTLASEITPISGEFAKAQELKVGYFAQHQLDQLRLDFSPLQQLQTLAPSEREQTLRDYLGSFAFVGDKVDQPIEPLSGGEKARLALALIVYQRPNLLLLDEPTNHLDLDMRHAMNLALQEFEGALIIVSHDRHLLRSVTDDFLIVHNHILSPFTGDLDDYHQWLKEEAQKENETVSTPKLNSASDRKEQKRLEAEKRQKLKPLRDKLKRCESTIEKLNTEKQKLENTLADADIYADENKDKLRQLLEQQTQTLQYLQSEEALWLELSEQLEALMLA